MIYQVYPRSFADANGDGTGDIAGIRQRLPYLSDLGVDAIWISPWYPSPLNDGGYDVADYRSISNRFGTLADAEHLIDDAHRLGIRVIIDLVPNHTSSDHAWFQAALAASPGAPERERYIFRPGRGDNGALPPTNWTSVFGGPAWSRLDDGEWYLHLFDSTQPDLNWDNDEVQDEFDDIFRFWIDRGIDGFRIDVAHGLVKDRRFPDIREETPLLTSTATHEHPYWDREGVHDIIRRWRTLLDHEGKAAGRDLMMVAEAWVPPERLARYVRPDEYHQSFHFDFITTPWNATAFRDTAETALTYARSVGSSPTWVMSNHDVMRHATRLGLADGTLWQFWPLSGPVEALDAELGLRRARAITLFLMALPGSLYLYQGEELGLPEVWDLPPEVLDDPVWENTDHQLKGRDGCRVPLPWEPDGPSFGFGDAEPWLPQPQVYGKLAASTQVGVDGSTLEMYRAAIALRHAELVDDEEIDWIDHPADSVLALRRPSGMVSITNFGPDPVPRPQGELLLSSSPIDDLIPANTTVWLRER